jgi:hypothetical protein
LYEKWRNIPPPGKTLRIFPFFDPLNPESFRPQPGRFFPNGIKKATLRAHTPPADTAESAWSFAIYPDCGRIYGKKTDEKDWMGNQRAVTISGISRGTEERHFVRNPVAHPFSPASYHRRITPSFGYYDKREQAICQ